MEMENERLIDFTCPELLGQIDLDQIDPDKTGGGNSATAVVRLIDEKTIVLMGFLDHEDLFESGKEIARHTFK